MKTAIWTLGLILGFLPISLLEELAHATSLSLIPSVERVEIGDPVEVTVMINNLGNMSSPSLSVFDLVIDFEPTVLSFMSANYGDPILGNQLDLSGFGSFSETQAEVASVNVFELSQDLPEELNLFQVADFTLVTLNFTAIGVGNSAFSLSNSPVAPLGDAFGLPLPVDEVETATITVVPEPLTILGSGTAIIFGAWFKKKGCVAKNKLTTDNS